MPYHSTSMESAMDQQSDCWMWIRRKLSGRPHLPCLVGAAAAASDDSWERQAFAEDSADGLGGCIWPPRSYSCSFCRREFRSAQALGGHMNVHRRDRARLKLSPVTYMENYSHPRQQLHHHNPNPCSTMASQYPPQVCALLHGNSPNLRANISSFVPSRTPLSPSRVSVVSAQESLNERTFVSPSFSATPIEENNNRCLFSTPLSLSNQISLSILTIPELKLGNGDRKAKNIECGDKRGAGMLEEAPRNKRRRLDLSINPFLKGSPQSDANPLQSRALGLSVDSPIMELDLELRLGDRPKVK